MVSSTSHQAILRISLLVDKQECHTP